MFFNKKLTSKKSLHFVWSILCLFVCLTSISSLAEKNCFSDRKSFVDVKPEDRYSDSITLDRGNIQEELL